MIFRCLFDGLIEYCFLWFFCLCNIRLCNEDRFRELIFCGSELVLLLYYGVD